MRALHVVIVASLLPAIVAAGARADQPAAAPPDLTAGADGARPDEPRRRKNRALGWVTLAAGAIAAGAGVALWNEYGHPATAGDVRLQALGIGLVAAGGLAMPLGGGVLMVENRRADLLPSAALALGVGLLVAGVSTVLLDGEQTGCQETATAGRVCFEQRDTRTSGIVLLAAGGVTTAASVAALAIGGGRGEARVSLRLLPTGVALGGRF